VLIGDNYRYLTYYVHLAGIKEVIDDTGKSLLRAGNRNPIYWPSTPLAAVPIEEFW